MRELISETFECEGTTFAEDALVRALDLLEDLDSELVGRVSVTLCVEVEDLAGVDDD